ncbi:choice-of-anchor M domain-containing protein [Microbacterium marinilacus]|nr:choice-of-anchor M domain-containing protein [Microbacterium marinilacus]MBY0687668.1 choice-of-anchor M domain-containing protein [Microbacterium marinilacus]
MLENVHTDAVSVFWEEDTLTLATKADVDGALAKPFAADEVVFHLSEAAKRTVPSGLDFVGPAGSTMWFTPQGQNSQLIWPGFSTQGVPSGVLDDDEIVFTLDQLDGPGDAELWLQGDFGGVGARLWSSDEDHKSFARSTNVHMHANWAFTAAGIYDFHVTASASVGGAPISATATYTFVVGELPAPITTSTTLSASASSVTPGAEVTLDAAVVPADANGFVEFRDGERVLGHERTVDGRATFTAESVSAGDHPYTAAFVPESTTFTDRSVSEPVVVKAVDGSGVEFGIGGMSDGYSPGDLMTAHAVGATLEEGQQFRWQLRTKGFESKVIVPQSTTSDTYSRTVDATADDSEISVSIYDPATRTTLAQTPWVPVEIEHEGEVPVVSMVSEGPTPLLPGDVVRYSVGGRQLGEGESIVWGFPWYAGLYGATISSRDFEASYEDESHSTISLKVLRNPGTDETYGAPLVATIVKNGVAIASSAHEPILLGHRELNVSGLRNLYREGGNVESAATLYPVREVDDLSYTWTFHKDDRAEVWGEEHQLTADLAGPVLSVADHHGGSLRLTVYNHGEVAQTSAPFAMNVTSDLGTQILEFSTLADHYHQGDPLSLDLTVDPAPLSGDSLEWQWKWPGTDWTPMTGVEDNRYTAVAEQALDGVEIRAALTYADDEADPLVSETRIVHVNDHGALPRQATTVKGASSYVAEDEVELVATVTPKTVLEHFLWERKAADEDAFSEIEGESGNVLRFDARVTDDGAEYRATPVLPNGSTVYKAADPLTLTVASTEEPGTEEPGTEEPGTDEPGTEEPGTDEPGTEEPGTDEPGTEEPGTDQPGTEEPGTDKPGTDQPGTEEPGTEEPGTDQPGTEEPGTEEPGTDEPGTEEPGTEEPGTDEPGTDQPSTDEPSTDEPGTDQPGTDQPGTDEPSTDEPGTDQPGTDQPGTDEPGTDQPGAEEPSADEPAVVQPSFTPAPPVADGADLPAALRDRVSATVSGRTVSLGGLTPGGWHYVYAYSEPTGLGWVQADGEGLASTTLPAGLEPGVHRIAVLDADGDLIGWTEVTVGAGGLAATGSDGAAVWGAGALAVLLLVAGGALLVARRRGRVTH